MKLLKLTEALLAFAALTLFSVGAQATVINTLTSGNKTDILCRQKALDVPYVQNCWTAANAPKNGNGNPGNNEILSYFDDDPADTSDFFVPGFDSNDLLYKAEYDGGKEEGTLANSYTTMFDNSSGNVEDATITHVDGTPSVDCLSLTSPCFLLIKGGQDPYAYLFNLALGWDPAPAKYPGNPWSVDAIPSPNWTGVLPSWDGTAILDILNFGVNRLGSISHVALYGSSSGGVSPVPVPAAFWLFGTALLGFIGLSRGTRV